MRLTVYFLTLLFLFGLVNLTAQRQLAADTAVAQSDTLPPANIDTIPRPDNIAISEDALDAKVFYEAEDSSWMEAKKRLVHLKGNALIKYQSFELQADYIVFHLDSNIAIANGLPDSSGVLRGIPQFSDGTSNFEAKRLRYNFKTQKGIIYEAVTKEGDLYIHGNRTKFIGGQELDTLTTEDEIYNKGALITTCDHPTPHYGIRSSKIKTVPSRLAVIGPSNLEINGVPTFLWLPFGFFPVTSGRRSGLLFPTDYEYSETWGFGLRDIGYYFPISDNVDLKVLGDIYFNGSWGLTLNSNYKKRYNYSGSIQLSYAKRIEESPGDFRTFPQTSFSVRVSHNQDAKAHPYRRLGGSISFQTNDHQRRNYNDVNSALTNTYSSNFNWSRTFPELPFSVSLGMNHSQNTNTNQVTVNAPNIDFRMNRIYPFKKENRVGDEKWFERITLQYSGNAKARFTGIDSTFFSQETLDNSRYGVQHRASTDLSFNVLKYLNVTPSVSYDETWFFQTIEKEFVFDPTMDIELDTVYNGQDSSEFIVVFDTTSFGTVRDQVRQGFTPNRHVSAGVSVNTQIFGTLEFKKGLLRGVRHTLKPTFSLFYEPKTSGRYQQMVQSDIRPNRDLMTYNIFQGGIYGANIVTSNRATFNYSFNNIFEAKLWSKRDSTEKKLKLFDNIIVNGNINLNREDTLNFSPVGISGTTRFLKGLSTFSFTARFDPYAENEQGQRINQFYLDTDGKLLRFDLAQFRLSTRFTFKQIIDAFKPKAPEKTEDEVQEEVEDTERPNTTEVERGGYRPQSNQQQSKTTASGLFDLLNSFSVSHNMVVSSMSDNDGKVNTMINTNSVSMYGSMTLTPNWRINVGNIGYDFNSKRLTYPDIGFSRDLHCWELSFSWQPERGTYLLHLGVKPGSLDFLKIPFRRNNNDAFGGF